MFNQKPLTETARKRGDKVRRKRWNQRTAETKTEVRDDVNSKRGLGDGDGGVRRGGPWSAIVSLRGRVRRRFTLEVERNPT